MKRRMEFVLGFCSVVSFMCLMGFAATIYVDDVKYTIGGIVFGVMAGLSGGFSFSAMIVRYYFNSREYYEKKDG